MKTFNILFITIFCVIFNESNAQVGINTNQPERTLDINGSLRIRQTEYKNGDTNYNKVLVTNKDGEIEYWGKAEVKAEMSNLTVENKKMYFSTSPDGNVIVPCGKIQLRFNTSTQPEIRLINAPTSSRRLYFSRIRMSATNVKNLMTNINVSIPTNNTWARIDNTNNASTYTLNTKDEYYLSYPGDANLYRITFLARKMSDTANSYTMICEKF